MTLLEQLAQLLADRGLGVYQTIGVGGSIFLAALPDKPDEAISLARYGIGSRDSDSKIGLDELAVQMRVRGTAADARTAEIIAQAVYDQLHGLASTTLAGGAELLLCVGLQGGPIYVGRDGNGRHEYTVNFRLSLRRVTPHRE